MAPNIPCHSGHWCTITIAPDHSDFGSEFAPSEGDVAAGLQIKGTGTIQWEFATVWPMLKPIMFWRGETATQLKGSDRIPSTTPDAEPPRDARDSGSARSHSTHLETSSSD